MNDYIRRDKAIDALHTWFKDGFEEDKWWNSTHVLAALEALPSADVQPVVHGEWIDYTEDGYVECPYCHSATNCDGNKDELHFCFSCGADMRG